MQGIFQKIHFRSSLGSLVAGLRMGLRAFRNRLMFESPPLKSKKTAGEDGRCETEMIPDPERQKQGDPGEAPVAPERGNKKAGCHFVPDGQLHERRMGLWI